MKGKKKIRSWVFLGSIEEEKQESERWKRGNLAGKCAIIIMVQQSWNFIVQFGERKRIVKKMNLRFLIPVEEN